SLGGVRSGAGVVGANSVTEEETDDTTDRLGTGIDHQDVHGGAEFSLEIGEKIAGKNGSAVAMHAMSKEPIEGIELFGPMFNTQASLFAFANHVTGIAGQAFEVGFEVGIKRSGERGIEGVVMEALVDWCAAVAQLQVVDAAR